MLFSLSDSTSLWSLPNTRASTTFESQFGSHTTEPRVLLSTHIKNTDTSHKFAHLVNYDYPDSLCLNYFTLLRLPDVRIVDTPSDFMAHLQNFQLHLHATDPIPNSYVFPSLNPRPVIHTIPTLPALLIALSAIPALYRLLVLGHMPACLGECRLDLASSPPVFHV
ncbi:unnamed protein product [Dicrocoelium dendriticum]|nr:unnamed protein product [Dicrocoelium dendriticum]